MGIDELKTAILQDRVVVLPCKPGDVLWIVSENDDTGEIEVLEAPPVKAVSVFGDGKFAAMTYEDGYYDTIGGPTLFLTAGDAICEKARRLARRDAEAKAAAEAAVESET